MGISMVYTYCSTASLFIPSKSTPVTFSFKYLLAGAPCIAAFAGNGGGASILPLVFLEGVAVRCAVGVAAMAGEGFPTGNQRQKNSEAELERNYRSISHFRISVYVRQWGCWRVCRRLYGKSSALLLLLDGRLWIVRGLWDH